jgi:hypothetical protein
MNYSVLNRSRNQLLQTLGHGLQMSQQPSQFGAWSVTHCLIAIGKVLEFSSGVENLIQLTFNARVGQ